jgi:hypothetical protein
MKEVKRGFPGVGQYPFMLPLSWMTYPLLRAFVRAMLRNRFFVRRFPAALTNMGPIAPAATDFDGVAERAWLLTPPIYPPIFGSGISGYCGSISFSAGLPLEAIARMEAFYERLLAQLP